MKRGFVLVLLLCTVLLGALSQQEMKACYRQSQKALVDGMSFRNDYTHLFINVYPYTLMLYHQAREMHYTQMLQYAWDTDLADWSLISELNIDYDGDYPTVFTQSMSIQGMEFTMMYTFTTTGDKVTGLVISHDMTGQMMDMLRETYSYDGEHWIHLLAEGNLIVQWENDYQQDVTWVGDNVTQVLEQSWNTDEQWDNDCLEVWEYSGSDPMHYTRQYWDGASWGNDEQEAYTYSGDTLTEELGQMWDNSQWVNDYRVEYQWADGLPSNHMEYEWDGTVWIEDMYVTYYAVDNELSYVISQVWIEGREWVNSGKYVYHYGEAVDGEDVSAVKTDVSVYPNPFNPSTNISFSLASDSRVTLDVYNIRGQKVEKLYDGYMKAGIHSMTWDAKTSSGVYFVVLNSGTERVTKKLVLMK